MIQQIELVSWFFNYHEEYVLEKWPGWLSRKARQAERQEYETDRLSQIASYKGAKRALSEIMSGFSGKKDPQTEKYIESIISPEYDVMLAKLEAEKQPTNFDTTLWWE